MKAAFTFGLLAAVFASSAAAQGAPYVGAGFGQSKAKEWCSNTGGISCDDRDTAWRAFGGYQFNRNFAAELGYTNLGKFTASVGGLTDDAKVNVWDLSLLAAWPLMNQFSVYGRLGGYRANAKEETNFAGNFEHSNTDLTYGLGAQYDFTRNLGMRVEWQRYAKVGGGDVALGPTPGDKSDIDVVGLSALWRF
ncbi:MAG TPA: outer membrane beta-barrel protein [Burkholderiales bacterium]|nr:outer membrane beta-barrel protein [Burkholderiales bacterium]